MTDGSLDVAVAVLDIAGTTVDDYGAVYGALEDAVNAARGSVTRDEVDAWMGADKHEAIAALLGCDLTDERVESTHQDFRRRLDQFYLDRPPIPIPGVPEALNAFRQAGIKVVLTTGFDRGITDALLGSIGWDNGTVDAVICSDDVVAGRPAPHMIHRAMEVTGVNNPSQVVVAGDTVRDIEAGRNAKAAVVVGVLSGQTDEQTLRDVDPTYVLSSVAELPGLLGLEI